MLQLRCGLRRASQPQWCHSPFPSFFSLSLPHPQSLAAKRRHLGFEVFAPCQCCHCSRRRTECRLGGFFFWDPEGVIVKETGLEE